MAQYKVPQDVEADDKLLGPFSFRQFVYLMIAAGLIALAWTLFQILVPLVIIPIPFIVLFGVLALPLRKDQPMEAYLAAIVNFYLKPKLRFWHAGQRESTIQITVPKIVEKQLTKTISEDEASRRLSFLAEVADTEGRSIKGATSTAIREEFVAEADAIDDMFNTVPPKRIDEQINTEAATNHAQAVEKMQAAIEGRDLTPTPTAQPIQKFTAPAPAVSAPSVTAEPPTPPPALEDLANTSDLTVATIAGVANRITKKKDDDEVYISLH